VTLDVAGLPIGDGSVVATSSNGSSNCLTIAWLGQVPPGVVLTVTNVVLDGPFKVVDVDTAGCADASQNLPACVGDQLTADDNGGISCFVGVQWDRSSIDGKVALVGELHCLTVDSEVCQQLRDALVGDAEGVSFSFTPPSTTEPTTQPTETTSTLPNTSST
jgi:hypothetical protein